MSLFLESAEPMKVARRVIEKRWESPTKKRWLWWAKRRWWRWDGVRWVVLREEEVERELWETLEDAVVVKVREWVSEDKMRESKKEERERYAPNKAKVEGVKEALRAVCAWGGDMPAWVEGGEGKPKAEELLVFEGGKAVTVGKEGVKVWGWDEGLLTAVVVAARWVPGAKCPEWERFAGELGGVRATEMEERYYGGCMRRRRKGSDRKVLAQFGEKRSGKGTRTRLLKRLLGEVGYFGCQAESVAHDKFGTEYMDEAYVVGVMEIDDLVGRGDLGVFESWLKVVLGEDSVTRKVKFKSQETGVVFHCGVVLQGNEFPVFSDAGKGLSAKTLPLFFRKSWAGAEDDELLERLWEERDGIVQRWVRALERQERGAVAERWVVPELGKRVLEKIRRAGNPAGAFLEWGFEKVEDGWVSLEVVRARRGEYERQVLQGERLCYKGKADRVSDQQLAVWLIGKGGWALAKQNKNHTAGILGMRAKKGA